MTVAAMAMVWALAANAWVLPVMWSDRLAPTRAVEAMFGQEPCTAPRNPRKGTTSLETCFMDGAGTGSATSTVGWTAVLTGASPWRPPGPLGGSFRPPCGPDPVRGPWGPPLAPETPPRLTPWDSNSVPSTRTAPQLEVRDPCRTPNDTKDSVGDDDDAVRADSAVGDDAVGG